MGASNTTIVVRVNEKDKEQASAILDSVGTNLSAAINMLLKQIILQNGLPFAVTAAPGTASRIRSSVNRSKIKENVAELLGSIPDSGVSYEELKEERLRERYETSY